MCKGRILSLKVYIWVEALTKRQISLDMQKKKKTTQKQTNKKQRTKTPQVSWCYRAEVGRLAW